MYVEGENPCQPFKEVTLFLNGNSQTCLMIFQCMIMYQQRKLQVTAQQYIFIFFYFRKLIIVDCTQSEIICFDFISWSERSSCYQQYIVLRFQQLSLWQLKYQNIINFDYCSQTFQPRKPMTIQIC
ncbi:Hypothetical_protein [Hexamita inflata]|uniref:Hypothetical_protein n=1 Tax=Hexamita inflata TaxID=28002 RepID=A0ABP1H9A3_9EUKA